jgi:outer membrane protein assembly factor BamB
MFGNGRVFISHTHQDNALCDLLTSALDAWEVDYWVDLDQLSAGQELIDTITRTMGSRDIFMRVCTEAARQSPWVDQEQTLARSLRAPNRSGHRLMINLLMAPSYHPTEAEEREVVIDATQMTPGPWIDRLRQTLGIPPRGRHLKRRAFLGLGITSLAALGGLGLLGDLLLAPRAIPGYRATTHAEKVVAPAGASRQLWNLSIATDRVFYNTSGALSVGPSGVYIAASDDVLSLNLDGALRWQNYSYFIPGQTAPTLAGDTVYVLAQEGYALLLLALNAQDGRESWYIILEESSNGSYSTAPVVAAGNRVIVQYNDGNNSKTAVIDTIKQELLWQRQQQPLPHGLLAASLPDSAVWAAPALAAGAIYAGLPDGNLYAYDLASGSTLWTFTQFATSVPIQSTPVYTDGVVYFGRDDGVCYAVDAKTGVLRWQRRLPDVGGASGVSGVTLASGVLYLTAGSRSPLNDSPVAPQADVVCALDARDGTIGWETHPSRVVGDGHVPAYTMMKQPLFLNGTLYVTGSVSPTTQTRLDELYALDTSDGSVEWHYEAFGYGDTNLNDSQFFPSAPVAYNNVVYFVSGDATVYALSAS